jgi:hypothetical protein
MTDRSVWPHAIVVAIVGIVFALSFARSAPDTGRYLAEADNLVRAGLLSYDGVNPTTRDTPGFPLLLAAFIKAGLEPIFWARVSNGVWLGLIAAACGSIVAIFFRGHPQRDIAVVLSVYAGGLFPTILGSTLFVLTELPYTALWLWSHVFILRAVSVAGRNRWPAWAASGAMLALACYVRPVPLFYPALLLPVAVFAAVTTDRESDVRDALRENAGRAVVFMIAMGVLIAPWTVRNYLVTERLVLMNDGTGLHLYIGASQEWKGDYPDFEVTDPLTNSGMSFGEASNHLGSIAWTEIKRDPVSWIELLPLKLKRLWIDAPGAKQQIGSAPLAVILSAVTVSTIGLAFAGLWYHRRTPWAWILILPAIYTTALHALLFAIPRFRIPVEPYLICLGVAAVVRLLAPASIATRRGAARAAQSRT